MSTLFTTLYAVLRHFTTSGPSATHVPQQRCSLRRCHSAALSLLGSALCCILLTLNGSCVGEEVLPEARIDTAHSEVLSFGFAMAEAQRETRATEAADLYVAGGLNENKINNMVALLYEGETQRGIHSTQKGDLLLYPQNGSGDGTSTMDAVNGVARIFLPKSQPTNPYHNKSLRLIVVANYHGAYVNGQFTELQGKTLTQLNALLAPAANQMGAQTNPNEKQADFLMDGAVNTGQMTWGNRNEYAITSPLVLRRAAAKFRLRLSIGTIKDDANRTYTLVGQPHVALANGVKSTRLLSETMLQPTDRTYFGTNERTDFQQMAQRTFDGKQFWARPIPFYGYANAWGEDPTTETSLLVRLRLQDSGKKQQDFYYEVPINYAEPPAGTSQNERALWNRVVRNTVYDIQSNISTLGSIDPGRPVTVQAHIAVEQWITPTAIDGSIANAHYLVVKQTRPEMLATDELEIQYISDLPLDETVLNQIKSSYESYTDKGKIELNEGTNRIEMAKGKGVYNDIKITTTAHDGRTFIKVKSKVPINYVPLTIKFKARHLDPGNNSPLERDVVVTQYPPIYVTARQSLGTWLYWTSTFASFSPQGYYIDANGNQAHGAQGGGVQANGLLYTVHTIAPLEGMILGDATEASGKTRNDQEANNLISPEFIIASQWGTSQAVPQKGNGADIGRFDAFYGDQRTGEAINNPKSPQYRRGQLPWNTPRYPDDYYKAEFRNLPVYITDITPVGNNSKALRRYAPYSSAENRAARYFEDDYGVSEPKDTHGFAGHMFKRLTGNDWPKGKSGWVEQLDANARGDRKLTMNFPHNGPWRLPTRAELELVAKIQRDPYSAVKAMLLGTTYWTAQDNTVFNFETSKAEQTTEKHGVRPVFDSYKY